MFRYYFRLTRNQLILIQKMTHSGMQSLTLLLIAHVGIVTSIFWSPGLLGMLSAGLPAWVQAMLLFPFVACMVAVMVFAGTGLLAVTLSALYEVAVLPIRALSRKETVK